MVGNIQGSHDLALCRDQLSQRCIDGIPASVGQLNQDTPPIIRVILSCYQPSLDKSVYPVRHRSGRDKGFAE
jgi:hypothetical protein